MRIVWLPRGQRDLKRSHAYLAQRSPVAARNLVGRILAQVEMLATFPMLGRTGRVEGTRELIITRTQYIVAYRVVVDEVQVLAVIHAKRRWPKHF